MPDAVDTPCRGETGRCSSPGSSSSTRPRHWPTGSTAARRELTHGNQSPRSPTARGQGCGRRRRWLAAADIDYYASEYGRTGFTGALNRYRNLDRDWEQLAVADGATIEQPTLFVGGSRDGAVLYGDPDTMRRSLRNLRRLVVLPGCGHRVQQERADDVTALIAQFFANEAPAGASRRLA